LLPADQNTTKNINATKNNLFITPFLVNLNIIGK